MKYRNLRNLNVLINFISEKKKKTIVALYYNFVTNRISGPKF